MALLKRTIVQIYCMGWEFYNQIIEDFKNKDLLLNCIAFDPYTIYTTKKAFSLEYIQDNKYTNGFINSKVQLQNRDC